LLQSTRLKAASSCFNLHPDRVKFKLFGGSLLERSSLIIISDFRFGQPEPTTFNVDLTKQCRHELEITSIRQKFLHNKNIKGGSRLLSIPAFFIKLTQFLGQFLSANKSSGFFQSQSAAEDSAVCGCKASVDGAVDPIEACGWGKLPVTHHRLVPEQAQGVDIVTRGWFGPLTALGSGVE